MPCSSCSLAHAPLPHKHAVTPTSYGRECGGHAPPTDPAEREDMVGEEGERGEHHKQEEREDPWCGACFGILAVS